MCKLILNMAKMAPSGVRWAFNWADWNPTVEEFSYAISCIQLDEKERLGRFVFRKDSRASLIGRLLMRKFVNEYVKVPYDKIMFTRDEGGRPILEVTPGNVAFNVSHHGRYTVLAGETKKITLGVDVMKEEYTGGKELKEFFRIMNRNFSTSEWEEIRGPVGTPQSEQIAMFCRHWALKESYVKALGVGIVVNLQKLNFKTKANLHEHELITNTELYIDGLKQNWLFEESLLDSDHCVAVALQENGSRPESQNVKFRKIDFAELMSNAVPLFPEDPSYSSRYFAKSEKP
ncbi:L-aminoadipate-semialdehyde dehydrogenase-phosphopantetheinyl transferase [Cephus cinctus]|uniref:L-aminoadipate-semialdehyde dehydrogenase-phosphopantetheinyl transferase n=1 Tax=Cephus cinctus TaxID=211228 RepID=A0AAJ7RBH5_CEPCN|nr:L-aminoadipate-semialdehyde dehydrogenase-phosphopantetheinyl transferase [Cephus cinctus]